MAIDQLLTQRQIIAAKSMAFTEGPFDASVLAIAHAKLLKFDPVWDWVTQSEARTPMRDTLDHAQSIRGGRYADIKFTAELRGSGAVGTAPAIGVFLKACGMSETINVGVDVLYECSNIADCLSIAQYRDGQLFKATNARGNFVIDSAVHKRVPVNFSFMGASFASDITDSALLTGIAYEDVVPRAFKGVTDLENFGIPVVSPASTFKIDRGAKIEMIEDYNFDNAGDTGYFAARMTGPNTPKGSIDPIAQLLATDNPYAKLFTGATGTGIMLTLGTVPGNIVVITCQLSQIETLKTASRTGHIVNQIDLNFPAPEFSAGTYSPFSIKFM